MKKLLVLIIVMVMVASVFVGCQKQAVVEEPAAAPAEEPAEEMEEAMYTDGVYFARDEIGESWTYFVIVTVEGGVITDTYWTGTNFVPAGDKYLKSVAGTYGMVAYAGAASFWYEQADAAKAWLLENQDPTAFEALFSDEEGHTDALTTDGGAAVSIHVSEYFTLVEEALASDAVVAGAYSDTAVVTAVGEPDSKGWKAIAEFIVVNGTIVAVDFDALYTLDYVAQGDDANAQYFVVDGDKATAQSKDQIKEGYGMINYGGSTLEWYQQAELLEAYVLENQDIYAVNEDGYADDVAGVSVHANGYEALFNQAFGQ